MDIASGGRGRGERVGAPLFTGQLRPRAMDTGDEGPDHASLRLDLRLNPTRYLAHQYCRRFAGASTAHWSAQPPRLFRRALSRERATNDERPLDGQDNLLLGPAALAHGRSEVWSLHLERYWTAVLRELDQTFASAAIASGGVVQPGAQSLNLRSVETYWEFSHPDPTALVRELEPLLFAVRETGEAREFDYVYRATDREHNARSVTIRLRRGVMLKVYAKTTRRVRFEIEHVTRKLVRSRLSRHTSDEHGALLRWLPLLAEDAADELNGVLASIEALAVFPPDSLQPYHLIARTIEACGSREVAETALSLLVNNGTIRLGDRDPLRPLATSLLRAGLIERRDRYSFVVARVFRRAVAELRGQRRTRPGRD